MEVLGSTRVAKVVEGSRTLDSVGPVRHKFVLFGSSIVERSLVDDGWGAHLVDIYARKADIYLRGDANLNSRLALDVLDEIFPKYTPGPAVPPALIIVYFGGNDSCGLDPCVPLEEYVQNMRQIATHLKSLSNTTNIIFLGCLPMRESPPIGIPEGNEQSVEMGKRSNEIREMYSKALINLGKEMDLKVIDLFNATQKENDWPKTCFLDDGIHLSAVGSEVVVREILAVLKVEEWHPNLYYKSIKAEFSEDSPYDPLICFTLNVSEFGSGAIDWD